MASWIFSWIFNPSRYWGISQRLSGLWDKRASPCCGKFPFNIFANIWMTHLVSRSQRNARGRRVLQFSFVRLQRLMFLRHQTVNTCVHCVMRHDESEPVPVALIHWALDSIIGGKWEIFWKPLLKSPDHIWGGQWTICWLIVILLSSCRIPEHQQGIPGLHIITQK